MEEEGPIILFDAECVLCSTNAQFVLTFDKKHHYRLASMQGSVGSALYRAHGFDPRNPSSMIIIEGSTYRQNSDAVLSIYETLGYPWRVLRLLRLIPEFMRDPAYRWIAQHRYRIFGKRTSCWLPQPEHRSRIL